MKNGRLIWIPPSMHEAAWRTIATPDVLLCSLQPKQIETWRNANKWAESIDMIIFTDDDPPSAVKMLFKCVTFAEISGSMCPHIVVNAPPASIGALNLLRVVPDTKQPAKLYQQAVQAVARGLVGLRCAWIQPESDHSIGACTLAHELGLVAAFSGRAMIDSIGALAAGKLGVNVKTLGSVMASQGET